MIRTLAFAGYRSLRELRIAVGQLTVITGGNGAGKSNVYRALRLLVDAAEGQLGRAMAREGGMPSAMWAGPAPKKAKSSERRSVSAMLRDDDGRAVSFGGSIDVGESVLSLSDEVAPGTRVRVHADRAIGGHLSARAAHRCRARWRV